jgi:YgiT-type zinc finger domain-containing protein
MRCGICRLGETELGTATITLERGGTTLVVKAVPAQVCQNCGEVYLDEEIAAHLLHGAEQAVRAGRQESIPGADHGTIEIHVCADPGIAWQRQAATRYGAGAGASRKPSEAVACFAGCGTPLACDPSARLARETDRTAS